MRETELAEKSREFKFGYVRFKQTFGYAAERFRP